MCKFRTFVATKILYHFPFKTILLGFSNTNQLFFQVLFPPPEIVKKDYLVHIKQISQLLNVLSRVAETQV